MRSILIEPDYEAWRSAARSLLDEKVHPDALLWSDDRENASLFAAEPFSPKATVTTTLTVPAAFPKLARLAAAHSDPRRWALLYQVLWRLTLGGERNLLAMATDREVRQLGDWGKAVSRDLHKMHAFVRFRLVGTSSTTAREQFVAWFEPDHPIVRLAAPFFEKRFAGMDWSIMTPSECAHWDGEKLHFSAGLPRGSAPTEDALDDLWRTYYRNIFNPARVKIRAMQSEMPKKFWKNLPEAPLIAGLLQESAARVEKMLKTPERPVKAAAKNAYLESLHQMNQKDTPEKTLGGEDS